MQNLVFWDLPIGISKRNIQIHFSSPPLPGQILSFYVQNSVFWSLPKGIQNRRCSNTVYYSCSPLKTQILPFFFCKTHQNLVFWCLPIGISNRRYSTTFFPLRPCKARFSHFMYMQNSVLKPSQGILNKCFSHILFLPTPESVDSTVLCAKLGVWGLPKCISNRKYSNTLFLPTPARADSPTLCAKLDVCISCQNHFK